MRSSVVRTQSSADARSQAFTLVELLVVIGIIALLISVLLPVLGKVRGQANTVACSANLRSIGQSLAIYTATSRGALPLSRTWGQVDPNSTPYPNVSVAVAGFPTNAYYTPASMLDAVVKKPSHSGLVAEFGPKDTTYYGNALPWSKVFRCPEVPADFSQPVTYAFNPNVFPSLQYDPLQGSQTWAPNYYTTSDRRYWLTSQKINGLYADTAVSWDTSTCLAIPDFSVGFVFSWIDYANLLQTKMSGCRFRYTPDPAIGRPDEGYFAQNTPIWIPRTVALVNGTTISGNADAGDTGSPNVLSMPNVLINGARFRHQKDSICNVLFADGSVRGLKIYPGHSSKPTGVAENVLDNEFLRKYLMVRPQKAPVNLD
jgi:prepilin-type N-terminal cleavage/methylation domain-containing protein/prepilin-type processing-associated H-X9-DG protein